MRFERKHAVAVIVGIVILLVDMLRFRGEALFVPLIAVALVTASMPYWIDFFASRRREREYEGEFLEFVRNLVGAVKSGMPVSKAIIHVSSSDYGGLTPFIRKLARQLEWSVPFHRALVNFANETRNSVIRRAISTVIEAEQAGGNLEDVLTAITESLVEIKKIAQQRRASIQGQVIQSYIIFFVFLGVMIVIQNLLIPYISGIEQGAAGGLEANSGGLFQTKAVDIQSGADIDFSSISAFTSSMAKWFVTLRGVFLMLTMIQGMFAGLIIGKLSEGQIAAGLKHSLVLVTIGFIVISLAQGL